MIASPCTKVCVIDPATGWCRGCLRALDEIAGWSGMDDGEKQAVLARIEVRSGQAAPGQKI